MRLRWRLRKRAVIVGLAVVALLAGVIALAAVLRQPTPVAVRNLRIPVVDGPRDNQRVVLDATFFTPAGQGRVPAILLAPGFGETKDAVQPQAEYLARAGFAVLTWSPRGTGASTGQIALNSPDYEIKDTEQLVSWLARQPRVLVDHPGDPRAGIAGASYGGGLALLAAAYDHRIDAVVAQSAWNNLATALFPNAVGGGPATGVFKKQWAGLLFTQGSVGFGTPLPGQGSSPGSSSAGSSPAGGSPPGTRSAGALANRVLCGRFLPSICAMYQQIAQTGQATPGAVSTLLRSSPASVAGRMDAPALLIQGEHDSLFDLGQANANYQAIRRNGAPADMVWFAGGHDGGDPETNRVNSLTAAWFGRWLTPGQSAAFTSAPLASSLQVTGSPTVRIQVSGPGEVTLFAKVYDVDQGGSATLPYQLAAPLRISGAQPGRGGGAGASGARGGGAGASGARGGGAGARPGRGGGVGASTAQGGGVGASTARGGEVGASRAWTVTVALPAIDYSFSAGHRLRLVLTTTDFSYANPPAPAVYRVALAGPGLTVPTDPALTVTGAGAPWWVWAAPAAALVAAVLILV